MPKRNKSSFYVVLRFRLLLSVKVTALAALMAVLSTIPMPAGAAQSEVMSFAGKETVSRLLKHVDLAQQAADDPYIVKSDRGGSLSERLEEIRKLRRDDVAVQIQGRVCYSTCTMLLGLPNVCVNPKTIFGFHGPSRSGRKLEQQEFDYFSGVMAAYYPAPLKEWFMETGRHRLRGVYKIKGSELVRMGIAACQTNQP